MGEQHAAARAIAMRFSSLPQRTTDPHCRSQLLRRVLLRHMPRRIRTAQAIWSEAIVGPELTRIGNKVKPGVAAGLDRESA
jgi:hypothetical protein